MLFGMSDRFTVGLLHTNPQCDLPFPCVTNHEHLFDVVSEDLQRQLPFLHPPLPALQETAPASFHRAEHALHNGPQMVHDQPSFRITFPGTKGNNPCEATAWPTGCVRAEAEVRYTVFVGHQLAVGAGAVRRVTQDLIHIREVFDEACELPTVMPVPSGGGERVHHPGVHIDADMQFDTVASTPMSCDAEVVPGAALMGAEPGTIDRDGHLLPAEEPDDQVHRLLDVFDRESGHPSMDDAVPGEHQAIGGKTLAVFHVSFDAVIGLVQSYL